MAKSTFDLGFRKEKKDGQTVAFKPIYYCLYVPVVHGGGAVIALGQGVGGEGDQLQVHRGPRALTEKINLTRKIYSRNDEYAQVLI